MGFTHRDLVSFNKQVVFADIVYLIDIDYIRTVNLDEGLPVHLLFQVLDGIMRDVLFIEGYKLYIVAHAFDEQNIIIVQPNQFAIAFNKNMIGGRAADVVFPGRGSKFIQGLLKTLIGEWFFQKVGRLPAASFPCRLWK